jgi:hypothetical protein
MQTKDIYSTITSVVDLNAVLKHGISSEKSDHELFNVCPLTDWNQLPADLLAPFPCNVITFRKRAKKVVATKEPK